MPISLQVEAHMTAALNIRKLAELIYDTGNADCILAELDALAAVASTPSAKEGSEEKWSG